jgi:hypothetical protein
LTVHKRDGSGSITLNRNNGMADAAEGAGITQRRVPRPGEMRVPKGEARSETAAKTITS